MRYIPLLLLASAACFVAAFFVAPSTSSCEAGEPTPHREIDSLITQLGDDSFQVREAATRQLEKRSDAIPALRRALTSPDAEVARRAGAILDAFARREEKRDYAAFAELARDGAVDRAVERFVRRDTWKDEAACWKVLADLEDKLADLERQTYGESKRGRVDRRLKRDSANLTRIALAAGLPRGGTGRGALQLWEHENRWVFRAEEVQKGKRFSDFLIALSGEALIRGESIFSTMFSCGSITCGDVSDSLVVCDGDFTVQENITNSLIIARGNISCGARLASSRLISCGEVRIKYPKIAVASKIVEKEAKPLGFVKIFDPADVGITVESADGGVRVKSAEKGKAFAAAGVRADDLITTVNGQPVKDTESFRRLLRASLAVDGETVLKVRRDKQVREVRVPAPK
jgi:hypothetical protein